jgi:hypothetical protein
VPDRYRRAFATGRIRRGGPDYFVKLVAFDEIHAEVAATLALPDFMNWNDQWMVEAGSGFRFSTKALQMRFGSPRAQADDFERDGAIESFLMGAINYALTAPADFLQQLVIAEVSQDSRRSRGFLSIRRPDAIIAAGVNDSGYRFVCEQTKAGL